jgi:hypothetical protein
MSHARRRLEDQCLADIIKEVEKHKNHVFTREERRFWNKLVRSLPSFLAWIDSYEDTLYPEKH